MVPTGSPMSGVYAVIICLFAANDTVLIGERWF